MLRRLGLAISLAFVAGPAGASPLQVRNGRSIQVRIGRLRQAGIGVKPARSGWRLELGRTDAVDAEVVDVTAGAAAARWTVAVIDRALTFDAARFVADHAYRVQLRRGTRLLGSTLVYLYPPPAPVSQQIDLSENDAPEEAAPAPLPKSAL